MARGWRGRMFSTWCCRSTGRSDDARDRRAHHVLVRDGPPWRGVARLRDGIWRAAGAAACSRHGAAAQLADRMTLEIAGRTMFSFGMDRHGAALRDFVMEYGARLARPHVLDMVLPLNWPIG